MFRHGNIPVSAEFHHGLVTTSECGRPRRVPPAASDTLLGQSACAVTFAVTSVMLLRVRSFRVPLLGLSGEDVTEQVHLSKLNIQSYLL